MNIKNGCKHCNQPHDPNITCRLSPVPVVPVEFVFEVCSTTLITQSTVTVTVSPSPNSPGEFALHLREALEHWSHLPVVWVR